MPDERFFSWASLAKWASMFDFEGVGWVLAGGSAVEVSWSGLLVWWFCVRLAAWSLGVESMLERRVVGFG